MKTKATLSFRTCASGLIDLLIVLATISVLVALALPRVTTCGPRAGRISCVNNLKQLGLAARLWSNDHGDQFSWTVPVSSNGMKELALSGDLAGLFRGMSNEVISPKILRCPDDTKRKKEADFAKLTNKNISYFIGLDADETKPQTILSGDRNLSGGIFTTNRIMIVTPTNVLVWGKDMHHLQGNIGLGDGSAQQLNAASLQRQMTAHHQSFASDAPPARFVFP